MAINEPPIGADEDYRPGVGIMLLNDQWRVLVARRIQPPGDAWQMPQGGIQEGETPIQAAYREVKEELGVSLVELIAESETWLRYDLPDSISRERWKKPWRGQRQKWFVMRFTGDDRDIDLNSTEEPEFDAWRWIPVTQLAETIVSFKRQVYFDLLNEFSHLSQQGLVELLQDPIVRMTMTADGVVDRSLHALLQKAVRDLGKRAARSDQD
jgi:putative (di)nucleoside polyphosphate hydrolase